MSATLHVIKPRAQRAAALLKNLLGATAAQGGIHGENLAGYALISWDNRGAVIASYVTGDGPVAPDLLPGYAHTALTTEVAIVEAVHRTRKIFNGQD